MTPGGWFSSTICQPARQVNLTRLTTGSHAGLSAAGRMVLNGKNTNESSAARVDIYLRIYRSSEISRWSAVLSSVLLSLPALQSFGPDIFAIVHAIELNLLGSRIGIADR